MLLNSMSKKYNYTKKNNDDKHILVTYAGMDI